MARTNRPLFSKSNEELRNIASQKPSDREGLELVLSELSHRSSRSAQRVQKEVEGLLAALPEDPTSTSGEDEAAPREPFPVQGSLLGHLFGGGRFRGKRDSDNDELPPPPADSREESEAQPPAYEPPTSKQGGADAAGDERETDPASGAQKEPTPWSPAGPPPQEESVGVLPKGSPESSDQQPLELEPLQPDLEQEVQVQPEAEPVSQVHLPPEPVPNDPMTVPVEHRKAQQVFTYLKELNEIRTPVQRDIADAAWRLEVGDIPDHESCCLREDLAGLIDRAASLEEEAEEICRITRPRLSPAPKLPASLEEWVVGDWDNPFTDVTHKERLAIEDDASEETWVEFAADPGREKEWRERVKARGAWRDNEIPARRAAAVFDRVFDLHSRLDREAEKYELVLGDGHLRWNVDSVALRFPVLHQPIELDFHPEVPEFRLSISDRPSTFHSILFRGLNITSGITGALRRKVEEDGVTPLDRDDAEHIYRSLAGELHSKGAFGPGAATDPSAPRIEHRPVFFLRDRAQGFGAFIEKLLESGGGEGIQPSPPMLPVLGMHDIEPDGAAPGAGLEGTAKPPHQSTEVLLSKPANDEQVEVAMDLDRTAGVIVQGPPGTGKSHTIANLIGHLLAKRKSVLVTSHTSKALRVLREKIVEPLQPLAVSVITDDAASQTELELSIRRISERLGSDSADALENAARGLRRKRDELLQQIEKLRQTLLDARHKEFRSITVGGIDFTPSEAARKVRAGRGSDDWIPSGVERGAVLTLSVDEVEELYATNGTLRADDEGRISLGLPSLDGLPRPDEFEELVRGSRAEPGTTWIRCWKPAPTEDQLPDLEDILQALEALGSDLDALWPWEKRALTMFLRGGPDEELWGEFMEEGQVLIQRIRGADVSIRRHGPEWDGPMDAKNADDARAMASHLNAGKGLNVVSMAFRPGWRLVLRSGRVAGREPSTPDELNAIADLIEVTGLRSELAGRWQRLVDDLDTELRDPDPQPELHIGRRIERLVALRAWPNDRIRRLEGRIAQAGFVSPGVAAVAGEGQMDELARADRRVKHILIPAVEEFIGHCRRVGYEARLADLAQRLSAEAAGSIGADLHQAISGRDVVAYGGEFGELLRLVALVPISDRRRELIGILTPVAARWAGQLARREGRHGEAVPPGDVTEAWIWRQLEDELEARNKADIQSLQDTLWSRQDELRRTTAQLVERLAWAGQIRRTTGQARQDLIGYQQLLRRIGKGTGKRAPKLRRAAQEKLKSCKAAVPVWIMPLARVVESFDPRETRFDVVIIDEASQMDVMGLLAFHLAERVLVVGDDEQVSPAAVGQRLDIVDQLIAAHLPDIPNHELYDGQMSIYDLARTSFGRSRMLREHFRCVPEIIAYSNRLAYHGLVRPLRDGSSTVLKPPALTYRVRGGREDASNVNAVEAEHTTALIVAALDQPEYQDSTIGVISLLGNQHDLKVDELLRHHLPADRYVKHHILCGTPPQFQGDERDVVFLNLVKGPGNGSRLTKQAPDNKVWKQRFNVAASRARDQLWVVHSMDPGHDLQPDDIRYGLIEFARDPAALMESDAHTLARTESPFEQEVGRRLLDRGYRIIPQYPVGSRRIDLVVESEGGRVAVECDGDRFHTLQNLQEDLQRQAVLERLGWRFIRIRGTRFFRDPDTVMDEVFERLGRLGIHPSAAPEVAAPAPASELRERVVRRAQELLREWSGEDMEQGGPDLMAYKGGHRPDA